MSKAIPVRVSDDLAKRVDAWAADHGMKRSPALVALIELGLRGEPEAAPAPRPAPAPRGPVPAVELAKAAARGKTEVRKSSPRGEAARAALADAEAKAAHLAAPAGRVSMAKAMDAAGLMDYGTRPKTYGDRLKGAVKAKPRSGRAAPPR